jgi:hypothetical protein
VDPFDHGRPNRASRVWAGSFIGRAEGRKPNLVSVQRPCARLTRRPVPARPFLVFGQVTRAEKEKYGAQRQERNDHQKARREVLPRTVRRVDWRSPNASQKLPQERAGNLGLP